MLTKIQTVLIILVSLWAPQPTLAQADTKETTQIFRAGAATSNITPPIGTSINGNFQDVKITGIHDETYARCIVLDDGTNRLAIVTTDLCMVSREVLDKAKHRAMAVTHIPMENMMMSAIHTHSGGTACSVFNSDPDPNYLAFLSSRIADAVIRASNQMVPAQIGWGVGQEPTQVFNRRWFLKPGVSSINPFGKPDKVKTNPGIGNPNNVAPSGPIDPEVPVISIQTKDGQPIALLANYSLHYVGGTRPGEVSADYYGMFADRMTQLLDVQSADVPFVAMMSNGTSGNINNINFGGEAPPKLAPYQKMKIVANTLAAEAYKVYQSIDYHDWISLGSQQKEVSLRVRKPQPDELTRAKEIMSKAQRPVMTTMEEIYARESILLQDYPNEVPIILQAFKIGDIAITATPCEVFVEIGLEIKKKSPFNSTFSISLANGYNGYLPTPEHHRLGGYETWRARSSYLEIDASTKITESLLELLHKLKVGSD